MGAFVGVRPDATADSRTARVAGDTAFAVELYRKISEGDAAHRNLLFSPYSISVALGMLYAGAGGTTKTEMQKVLLRRRRRLEGDGAAVQRRRGLEGAHDLLFLGQIADPRG